MNALCVFDGVIPCCFDWYACEDDAEDGCDPENNDHDSNPEYTVSQWTVREYPDIGGDDGEFGKGYGGRVCEVGTVEGFGDRTNIRGNIEEVRAQIPDVFSEAKTSSYEGCY